MIIESGPHCVSIEGCFNLRMTAEMREHLVTQLVAQREAVKGEVYVRVPHFQPGLSHLTPRRLGEV